MPEKNKPNTKWDGKSKGGKLGHRIFVFLLRNFGLNTAFVLLYFVAFWFALFSRKGAKAQYYLFRKRLKYSIFKSIISVYKNHFRFGQILTDKVAILSGLHHKYTFEHNNSEIIKNMIEKKTGGILLNAHIGSWEAAGQLLKRYKGTIYIVMIMAEHEKIKEYLDKHQSEKKIKIIAVKEDGSHLIKIREVLKNKGIIAMHGDRYQKGNDTIVHNFLGKEAKFPAGPFHLAAKYNVPISFATAFREKRNHYNFHAMQPITVDKKGSIKARKKEVFNKSKIYTSELEKKIKEYPLQWFNYYQFWEE